MSDKITNRRVLGLLGGAVLVRVLTPTWSAADYALALLGAGGIVIAAVFVLSLPVIVLDLECPVKRWIGERCGFDYVPPSYDLAGCNRWRKRGAGDAPDA